MKTKSIGFIGAILIPFLAGCASTPVVLERVGPAPATSTAYAPTGWLRVLTATETHEIGDDTYYYPHTGYRIYTAAGKVWKFIPNHSDNMDETAALVQIPEGHYDIHAQSESYGAVIVPVLIKAEKTTEVHLESRWKIPPNAGTNEVVYLPNGDPVGWKSALAKSSE